MMSRTTASATLVTYLPCVSVTITKFGWKGVDDRPANVSVFMLCET